MILPEPIAVVKYMLTLSFATAVRKALVVVSLKLSLRLCRRTMRKALPYRWLLKLTGGYASDS